LHHVLERDLSSETLIKDLKQQKLNQTLLIFHLSYVIYHHPHGHDHAYGHDEIPNYLPNFQSLISLANFI